jgi:hypothetical protein
VAAAVEEQGDMVMTQQTVEPTSAEDTPDRTAGDAQAAPPAARTPASKRVLPRFLPGYYLG